VDIPRLRQIGHEVKLWIKGHQAAENQIVAAIDRRIIVARVGRFVAKYIQCLVAGDGARVGRSGIGAARLGESMDLNDLAQEYDKKGNKSIAAIHGTLTHRRFLRSHMTMEIPLTSRMPPAAMPLDVDNSVLCTVADAGSPDSGG